MPVSRSVFILVIACHIACLLASIPVLGLGLVGGFDVRVLQNGEWVNPPIGWNWESDQLLLDPASTDTLLFTFRGHSAAYGWLGAMLSGDLLDVTNKFHIEVAVSEQAEVSTLTFDGVENISANCVDVDVPEGDDYFRVGALVRPKPGFTWGDLPEGWNTVALTECECFGPDDDLGFIGVRVCLTDTIEVRTALAAAHVDATNTSGLEDGSEAHPFRTLQDASDALLSGTIYLAPGQYEGFEIANREIHIIGACGDEKPVIASDITFLNDVPSHPLSLESVRLKGARIHGGATDFTLRRVEVVDAVYPIEVGWDGILQADECSFTGCEGVVSAHSHNVSFIDCTFSDIDTESVLLVSNAESWSEWISEARFARCRFEQVDCPVYVGQGRGRVYAYFDNCVLSSCTSATSLLDIARGRAEFRHSTLVDVTAESLLKGYDAGVYFLNSILFDSGFATLITPKFGSTWNTYVLVEYSCHTPALQNGYNDKGGNITDDPMLVDPLLQDYRLSHGSPCIDSGAQSSLNTDFDGNARDQYPDIGAFEGGHGDRLGDLNGDGAITGMDARICLQIASESIPVLQGKEWLADVDRDGDVDRDDARILAEYVIGIRATLP